MVEIGAPKSGRLFIIKEDDDPATFTTEAGRRLQALLDLGPDELLCVGREEGIILSLHQKQLMNLENALIGFIHTGHTTVDQLRSNVQEELFVHRPQCGWGAKSQKGVGLGDQRIYRNWRSSVATVYNWKDYRTDTAERHMPYLVKKEEEQD